MATNPRIATIIPPWHPLVRCARDGGNPVPFVLNQPTHLSPQESDCSNEDWNGDRQRVREEEKKKQLQKEEKNKEGKVPNDYYPASPDYDPNYKQDLLPHCGPKEKQALDPNYYPPNCVPEEEDAHSL